MASAADQIAAPAKKTRVKAAPKTCGVPGCSNDVAAGAKLSLTVLESASLYPASEGGKLSVCKAHRLCVGFYGLSPELDRGSEMTAQCLAQSKVFYLGRSFCADCHMVYLWALLDLVKPQLTTTQINTVRTQVVKANHKKAVESVAAPAPAPPAKVKGKKAPAATTAVLSVTASAAPAAPKPPKKKAAAAAPVPAPAPAPEPESEEEEDEEEAETETDVPVPAPDATPVPAVVKPPPMVVPNLDQFEAEEQAAPVPAVPEAPLKVAAAAAKTKAAKAASVTKA